MKSKDVILANGRFPEHEIPLGYLNNAGRIVCCDGAIKGLEKRGLHPWAIVGDLDSVPEELREKYAAILHADNDQETNDLTKAVKYSVNYGLSDIAILGATGLRDDHTLGNISLLADYAKLANVQMVTDHGIFIPFLEDSSVTTRPGQQVSLFSLDPGTKVTAKGLKYPVEELELNSWWRGTLNESVSDHIELKFGKGRIIVYLNFEL